MNRKIMITFSLLGALLGIGLSLFFKLPEGVDAIFWNIRFPRFLLSFMAGAGLSIAGLFFQSLFKNDLASPYTLGVASGASFGASLSILLGVSLVVELGPIYFDSLFIFSFLGALLCVFTILGISRLKRSHSAHYLILAGIIVSFVFSSAIMLMQFLARELSIQKMVYWVMGDLSIVGYRPLYILYPICLLVFGYLYFQRDIVNILSMGDRFALSKGIEARSQRKKLFIIVSFLISIIVSICGPIGFVGLVIPHIVKRVFGHNLRQNYLATLFFGGAFLVWCDFIGRFILKGSELPVGVVTSCLGGPFFLYLLVREKTALR